MANDTSGKPAEGEIIQIPKVSPISGRVTVHRDSGLGRLLFGNFGGLIVFLMAVALPVLPLILMVMLLRQPDIGSTGLSWVWISMLVITELLALLVSFGLVRSVLEGEA